MIKKDSPDQSLHNRADATRDLAARALPTGALLLTSEQTTKLLHELQPHQIELEMQNEELIRVVMELEASRKRYFDLYEFAPTGYLSLDENGIILEANHTLAVMLCTTKTALIKIPFTCFVFAENQDDFYLFLKKMFSIGGLQSNELRLKKKDGSVFWAHLEATLVEKTAGVNFCRVVVGDISGRMRRDGAVGYHTRPVKMIYRSALPARVLKLFLPSTVTVRVTFPPLFRTPPATMRPRRTASPV